MMSPHTRTARETSLGAWWLAAGIAASLVVGCGESDAGDAAVDAGGHSADATTIDASADAGVTPNDLGSDPGDAPDAGTVGLAVTVGTGALGEFVPHEDGQTLRLQRGCQGSQHVFTSVRVNGAAGARITVGVRIVRVSDGLLVSVPFELRLPFDADAPPGVRQITGLTPVIEDPADVLDQEVRVEVFVRDDSGAEARGAMRGPAAWGTTAC